MQKIIIAFWLRVAGWLQHRAEKRVSKAERIADRLIADADPDFARVLGILPPMPLFVGSSDLYRMMLGSSGMQQAPPSHYAALMQAQHQADYRHHFQMLGAAQQSRAQEIGGMLGGVLGNPLMGAVAGNLFGQLLGASKGKPQ